MAKAKANKFKFEISLSVLNHLGRNLYRNFITVIGEAISNSWDADAKNVWISIDRDSSTFSIKDDGKGMSSRDFQDKFLKIGYSKRAGGKTKTALHRPFIGAKGIGKLALLSCAKKVSIFSKTTRGQYVGGVIDNGELDKAIKSDLTPEMYPLGALDFGKLSNLSVGHKAGTIIVFEDAKEQIRNSISHIRKMIALSFRFSLLDEEFSIFVNGERITVDDLKDVLDATEFVWVINSHTDEFIDGMENLKHAKIRMTTSLDIKGFIASVSKPRYLKITGTDERATVDLFVNGRMREKNILRHIPTQRIPESYIYGQIHFDSMDRVGFDPFTSSREGVVGDDENFISLLDFLKRHALNQIFDKWDALRLGRGEQGDEDNKRKTKKERKARDLYAAASEEYEQDEGDGSYDTVDMWLDDLRDDAEFNISSYVDCFLSENLLRKYIGEAKSAIKPGVKSESDKWRAQELAKKAKANISFTIRKSDSDIDYLGMDALALTAEGVKDSGPNHSLTKDSVSYAPARNVIGHTGLLTDNAKTHLRLTYENIKARVRSLLSGVDSH